jgi:branched-chain amino acid aminotransferase
MADPIYYVNGIFVSASQASLPVGDLAIQRGYGIFESLRTYGGRPFRLDDHLVRLEGSAQTLGLKMPWSREQLGALVWDTLSRNDFDEASIRLLVTGGESQNFTTPSGIPSLVIMVNPLQSYPRAAYEQGVSVITAQVERNFPIAKTINYVSGMVALQRAREQDPAVNELIYVDRDGLVTEGFISNIFLFKEDMLVTPGRNILFGVTRQVVLELAASLFEVQVRDLSLQELQDANEVFSTGSVREIMPVVRVDQGIIADGLPGPRTMALMAAFRKMSVTWVASHGTGGVDARPAD